MKTSSLLLLVLGVGWIPFASEPSGAAQPQIAPRVEAEETVYTYRPADNGAGPMWCSGSTSLVRIGADVFASGIETLTGAQPLNNCRWLLFQRSADGWKQIHADREGRTREPSPLAGFQSGSLFLSVNPTLTARDASSGPAEPQILQFTAAHPEAPFKTLKPEWRGRPEFSEHSYRSFAADSRRQELVLFQNIGYTHAPWAFYNNDGTWLAGELKWPWGADYAKPQPIRVCYPNVALRNRAVYFCGVSDIIEPNPAWRDFKRTLTGREWDYDFRRLFFTWTPDITKTEFSEWIEVASREQTCGWISPGDLFVGEDGAAHILWSERALDERLREKFFPAEKQRHSLNYAVVQHGRIVLRKTLVDTVEGQAGAREFPGQARFHITPDGRRWVIYYAHGTDAMGRPFSENRLVELGAPGSVSLPVRVPCERPFTSFFTATLRAGSPPSDTLELLGEQAGHPHAIRYARIRLQAGQ